VSISETKTKSLMSMLYANLECKSETSKPLSGTRRPTVTEWFGPLAESWSLAPNAITGYTGSWHWQAPF